MFDPDSGAPYFNQDLNMTNSHQSPVNPLHNDSRSSKTMTMFKNHNSIILFL